MKFVRHPFASLGLALVSAGATAWAVPDHQHKPHHPAGAASGTAAKAMPGMPSLQIALMMDRLPAAPAQ